MEAAGVETASHDLSEIVSTRLVLSMVLSAVQEGTPTALIDFFCLASEIVAKNLRLCMLFRHFINSACIG